MAAHAALPGLLGPVDLALVRAGILEDLRRHEGELATFAEEYRQKCARVEDSMRALRAKYNTVSPIARLPAEILAAVFEAYFSDSHKRIVLLHICREWRRVACGTPRLWTHIVPGCEESTTFALQHSGQLPLFIEPSTSQHGPVEIEKSLQKIVREFSRIRAVFVSINHRDGCWLHPPGPLDGIPLTAPMLRKLHLEILPGPTRTVPPFFAALDMPMLSDLNIQRGSLGTLRMLIRPTLTSLVISFCTSVSVHAVIEVLDGMPLLENLQISNLEPDNFPMPDDAFPPFLGRTIALPHLRRVALQGGPPNIEMARLLNSLLFPQSTKIVFKELQSLFDPGDYVEHYAAVFPILIPKAAMSDAVISHNSSGKLQPCYLSLTASMFSMKLWTSLPGGVMEMCNTATQYEGEDAPRLDLYIPSSLVDSISCLWDFLDTSELVCMRITLRIRTQEWIHVLRNRPCPKLLKMAVATTQGSTERFIEALATPIRTRPESTEGGGSVTSSTRYLFPDLKVLELHVVEFRLIGDVVRPPRIFNALRRRAKSGLTLEKLVLVQPTYVVSERDVAALVRLNIARSVVVKQPRVAESEVKLDPLSDYAEEEYDDLQDDGDIEVEVYPDSVDEPRNRTCLT